MNIMLDKGARMPEKAHRADAGYDLFSREEAYIPAGKSHKFDTGVHMEIPDGYAGLLVSKSGLNVNYGLTSEGLIDSGYSGSIVVKLYNQGQQDVYIEIGQKISQIVIIPVVDADLTIVDKFAKSERGSNGFGSSGR